MAGIERAATRLRSQTQHDDLTSVWDAHDDESYRQDQSHWRGVGRWDDEVWVGIGNTTWKRVHDLYYAAHRKYPIDPGPVLLEWGPGGGANLFRFAPHAAHLYGVDIAAKNLDEAARVLDDHAERFTKILLDGAPSTIVDRIDRPIDLVVSTAVFQHFPSQDYGGDVLRAMHSVMAPDALGYVQIRFDNGTERYRPKVTGDYRVHHLTATSWDLSAFWDLLVATGFRPLMIANVNTSNNYAGIYFAR